MFSHLFKHHIFFVLIILIIYINYAFCEDDAQFVTCRDSQRFQCANMRNVPYPFWGSNTPSYCGHPGFELNCTGAVPQITIESITYRVLDLSDDTNTLTVARADYWDNLCPKNSKDTVLKNELFESASATQNLTIYYGCNIAPAIIAPSFSCSDNTTGKTNYYATQNLTSNLRNLSEGCSNNTVVRISDSSAEKLVSTSDRSDLSTALESGFGIVWKANDSRCEYCVNSGGVCGSHNVTEEFACYCKNGSNSSTCSSASSPASGPGSSSNRNLILKIGIPSGLFAGLLVLSIMIICCCRRNRKLVKAINFFRRDTIDEFDVEAFLRNYGSLSPKRYSYANVKKMTNSFAEEIGKGGYGAVYKGKLPDGCFVAVKILNECKGNGEEFINEVASICRTSHVNVVTLLGFCYERTKRALVYEYMPNGSLDKFIFKQEPASTSSHLEWTTLYEIAIGIARGLEYLHKGCNTRILHFDIKPHNILLDKNFRPKISDFGLSKLCQGEESIVSMKQARGTIGYIAPEVMNRNIGGVSHKSDVYSYGMMVLEMVGGRKNIELEVSRTSEIYFPNWLHKHIEDENFKINETMAKEEEEIAQKMIKVSLWCIQTLPSDRPPMTKVVEMLEGSVQSIEITPKT